jgi:hypothetical protein
MRAVWPYLIAFFLLPASHAPARAAEYIPLTGVIDVRTVFSDGEQTVEELTRLARSRGIDVVLFTDHDLLVMEYGLFPFEHVLRKRKSLNAIHSTGIERYLSAIHMAARRYPDMVLIPGCESAPYYYWTGSYFSGDLTAHDHEKRMLAVGLERPEDYEEMPVLHNSASVRYLKSVAPRLLLFAGAFIIGVMMLLREKRRRYKRAGLLLAVLAVLLAINAHPFRSSPYDQYMGDLGIAPYQHYIDHVKSRGGMVFWNYPETRSGVRRMGPVRLETRPYPQVLEEASDYTGFAAIYGDAITVTEPGRQWDRVLGEYCRGERQQPVWGISTADYHKESGAGGILGNFPTVLLVKEKTTAGVLKAMRAGRMYAARGRYPQRPVLEEFTVSAAGREEKALLGEEITLASAPEIRFSVSARIETQYPVTIRLIRGGTVIAEFDAPLPFSKAFTDGSCPEGSKTFYRLDVHGPAGVLLSNPVFVTLRPARQRT